jgi:hypothetical protein
MRKLIQFLVVSVLMVSFRALGAPNPQHGDPLTEIQKEFLGQYETVRAALAADDLPGGRTAAAAILNNTMSSQIVRSADLAEARRAFALLSRMAVKIAHGRPGYFVFHCPEAKFGDEWGHWVQTTDMPSNPYLGRANPTCGKIMR